MKGNEKKIRKKLKEYKCRVCGTRRGVIRKYNLLMCRRCFKEEAEKMGFSKYE